MKTSPPVHIDDIRCAQARFHPITHPLESTPSGKIEEPLVSVPRADHSRTRPPSGLAPGADYSGVSRRERYGCQPSPLVIFYPAATHAHEANKLGDAYRGRHPHDSGPWPDH